jgi:hypothetical protein
MDAYRRGLTGTAAEWAVKKNKQHCSVSNRAFDALEESLERAIGNSDSR